MPIFRMSENIRIRMSENIRKNIAVAMEKFEESAELGNVRSMGSGAMWSEKSGHPKFSELNEKWTARAALAKVPSPNSQIDYGKMLFEDGRIDEARAMFQKAADYGLEKGEKELLKLNEEVSRAKSERSLMDLEDDRVGSWAEMVQVARKESQPNQNTH